MLSRGWAVFRRFWLQEEVPRWIGLSLVAAFLCGLGMVTYFSHAQSRSLAERTATAHGDHAMTLLARVLATVPPQDSARQQALLREFSHRLDCERLCVTDERGIVVSAVEAAEVGQPDRTPAAAAKPENAESVGGSFTLPPETAHSLRRGYRLPITATDRPPQTLVGILRWNTATVLDGGLAWLLVIMLAAVGLLGTVYHAMRQHFRGVACIAENLITHGDRLEQELASLRIADSLGAVAAGWNRLIDLAVNLQTEAGRSTAVSELRQVLERSNGGELADAIDGIPDALLIITDENLLAHCNAAGARLMGWKQEDAVRTRLEDLTPSPTGRAVLDTVAKARRPDGGYEGQNATVESAGSTYRVRVVPQRKSRQHGACAVVVTDVSQQVRADRAREEFVSQVTHELRTPLTNIRAYTETLASGMFDDPKVVSECYNVINKETRRLSRLVEDILSMSQLEVGSIQVVIDDVDVRALIQDAVRDVRATADDKNIDLQALLPAKVEPLRADRDKLAIVLNNLLGNALKYTPRGGEVRVGCQNTDEHLLITVKDNGIGIDKLEQDHVFEKFHRSKDPAVQAETGTGIGLTTAREIARRHGGDIELVSEKGKGSTFVVKLPRKKSTVAAT